MTCISRVKKKNVLSISSVKWWAVQKNGGSVASVTSGGYIYIYIYYLSENEDLYRPTPSYVPVKCINCSRKSGFTYQDTSLSIRTAKKRQGNLERELGLTDIRCNRRKLHDWTTSLKLTQLLSHGVQFRVFNLTRVAVLVNKGLSRSKNKHKPIGISEAVLTPRACGKRARLQGSLANSDQGRIL